VWQVEKGQGRPGISKSLELLRRTTRTVHRPEAGSERVAKLITSETLSELGGRFQGGPRRDHRRTRTEDGSMFRDASNISKGDQDKPKASRKETEAAQKKTGDGSISCSAMPIGQGRLHEKKNAASHA